MKDLTYYLNLPWTIIREDRTDDGEYVVLRISELPGFLVAGAVEELEEEFWQALAGFLESYLEDGAEPPVPASHQRAVVGHRKGLERKKNPAIVTTERARVGTIFVLAPETRTNGGCVDIVSARQDGVVTV